MDGGNGRKSRRQRQWPGVNPIKSIRLRHRGASFRASVVNILSLVN